jgi:hypothetical protein
MGQKNMGQKNMGQKNMGQVFTFLAYVTRV